MTAAKLATLLMLLACRSPTPAASVENRTSDIVERSMFDEADRLLRRSIELDYSTYPSMRFRFRQQAVPLLDRACRAGDRRGCIAVVAIRAGAASEEGERRLWDRCVIGDVVSCRALVNRPGAQYQRWVAAAPGGVIDIEGFKGTCYMGDDSDCDFGRIRDECTRGLAMSCRSLANSLGSVTETEREQAWKRALSLAIRGCALGILTECVEILADVRSPVADQVTGLTRACRLDPGFCGPLGALYLKLGQITAARDAYEVHCQRATIDGCVPLAEAYASGELPEPVPNRARVLLAYACKIHKQGCDLLTKLPR